MPRQGGKKLGEQNSKRRTVGAGKPEVVARRGEKSQTSEKELATNSRDGEKGLRIVRKERAKSLPVKGRDNR